LDVNLTSGQGAKSGASKSTPAAKKQAAPAPKAKKDDGW
jgi:hypothetical protein